MSMHLVHPSLSMIGKKKGKFKWKSAEQKRNHEQLQESWSRLIAETSTKPATTKEPLLSRAIPKLVPPPGRSTNAHIPSLDTGLGLAAKKDNPVYTGDKVLGVSIVHKSCLQPVFSETRAKDFAGMRR